MMTVDEFQALLDNRRNRNLTNEIHFAIELDGVWKWRQYKTYDTNFGWCIYPADEAARESLKKASRWTHDCFAKVYKADGTCQEIQVPSPVFGNYDKNIFWFEYGKVTRKQFESKIKSENKRRGWKHEIVSFSANDIPREWAF